MAWLLDTDICSHAIRAKPPAIARRLSTKDPGAVMVSAVTVYEMVTGCEKSPARERLLKEVNAFLVPFPKIPFTMEDAWRAGGVRAFLEKRGTPIGAHDILLAAQALTRGLTIVTNNIREFRRIKGLKLEIWGE